MENKTYHYSLVPWWAIGLPTALIGNAIHHSFFWSIMDFLFYPLAWLKWLVCQEVTVSIIKSAFSWFLK